MEDTTHTVQQWIDDVVKYAPDLHRRLWSCVQDLLPPSSRGHPLHFPSYGALPVVAHDYPRFDVVKESVITIPEPRTVYGPIDLDDAVAAVAKIVDRQVLEVVEHTLRIDMQALVQPSSGFAMQQLLSHTIGIGPSPSLSLDDLDKTMRLVTSPPSSPQTQLTRDTLKAAGCLERGCQVASDFSITRLGYLLAHNGAQCQVDAEVLAQSERVDLLPTAFVRWARDCHAIEDQQAEQPHWLAARETARAMAQDLAREHERPPTQRQRDQIEYEKSLAANRVRLIEGGPSDSAPIRYPHNPWKDA